MEVEIYNPHDKPESELPTIFGFNNGGRENWWNAALFAEDGTPLGGHICSNESFMAWDLGIKKGSRSDRHEDFKKHYPDGYKMEFVSYHDVNNHEGLQAAFKLYDLNKPKMPEGITTPGVTIEVAEEEPK